MGPITVFDKSSLEQLSVDESCWLDAFFLTNITPLFYVETLADLAKAPKSGRVARTAEQIVGELAAKTPCMNSVPNAYHGTLLGQSLLGVHIDLSNRPVIQGGQTVKSREGKLGVHFKPFAEFETLQRWQAGEFLAIENSLAQQWRAQLSTADLGPTGWIESLVQAGTRFRDLVEVKTFVDQAVSKGDRRFLEAGMDLWGLSKTGRAAVLERYAAENEPPMSVFAPYAAFILRVDMVFHLAIASSLISADRPSNMVDVAYLYYLPFSMVFVSSDKLHARLAPLFMEMGQSFVEGGELKTCLAELDLYYSFLPEDVKASGIMSFAIYPPEHLDSLATRLWDQYLPKWREAAKRRRENEGADKPSDAAILAEINEKLEHGTPVDSDVTSDEADHVMITRTIPARKGKWRTVPEGLADGSAEASPSS